MIYLILAEVSVWLHLAAGFYTLLGVLTVWKWPHLAWVHLPLVLWMIYVNLFRGICPLAVSEAWFRSLASQAGYDIVWTIRYAPTTNSWAGPATALLFITVNGLGYWSLIFRARRQRTKTL